MNQNNLKSKQRRKNKKRLIVFVLILLALILGYYILHNSRDDKPKKEVIDRYNSPNAGQKKSIVKPEDEPRFKKEGELVFIDKENDKNIARIAIEIADEEDEIRQGLMFRSTMADTSGMLFIFKREKMQSFWMKNTKIPLDIIFINRDKEIVTIQKDNPTDSEESIPSSAPAKYVVEVNAGFCDQYNIEKGDKISFLNTF